MESCIFGAGLVAGLILGSPSSRRVLQVLLHRNFALRQEKTKLIIVVRTDLKMTTGKVAAQCAHAAVMSYLNVESKSPELCKLWMNTGQQKVVVQCDGEASLLNYVKLAKSKGIITSPVIDAGHTQVRSGTLTVAGIGPGPESLINEVTGKLRVY